jgi:predicted transcriptional regulator of viral defense system/very-short-patch-repair endonuclease
MDQLLQTRVGDRSVAELAERQHGVVGRGQLVGLGLSEEAVRVRLRAGRLHRVHPGVYAVGYQPLTQQARWMAAVLFCGEGAVLSHRSAAALWGIRGSAGATIHVTSSAKAHSRGVIQRHYSRLPDDETTIEDGIPVTSVPRTIFDLAAGPPRSIAERAQAVESMLRQAEYRELHDSLSLPVLLGRYPRRSGARAVRLALARRGESTGHTRSPLEERFLAFLDRHDLPRPKLNAWIEVGGTSCEVDCLWPAQRQIVELDGWQAHGTRDAFRQDRTRDRRLAAAGYGITRLTWSQLTDEPTAIARDLRKAL